MSWAVVFLIGLILCKGGSEAEILFGVLERLRATGAGIIYISHNLDEVFRLADRITVLRDGRTVGTYGTPEIDMPTVIARMVGREVTDVFPTSHHQPGDVV